MCNISETGVESPDAYGRKNNDRISISAVSNDPLSNPQINVPSPWSLIMQNPPASAVMQEEISAIGGMTVSGSGEK